ncbi:glycosyltransferase family 4 protein [Ornithinimicrobium cerasi]|uniref:D-inositol 3-phosphate glycosyltransferase n=1 Tax=Ornithinimicrobium cerasi TaxID=2248773 RepID=A0A285VRX9_9MICO|nr:glycosyltransferase family 4 protein [Ornithinimicrobium cerasi]SOC56802.1 Glycosyltransferase involved in cell wall bisynthesis [Ornithinimicrobium cerasi]
MRLLLVVPDRPSEAPSGGDRYDAALASALRGRGVDVRVVRVPGRWPWPTPGERRGLAAVLAGGREPVLVDGLVGSAAPGETVACAAVRPTAVLLHSRLSSGAGASGAEAAELDRRESAALHAVGLVVVPSRFAERELAKAYGVTGVVVAPPGTDPAPVATGSAGQGPPQLLTMGAVTPVKNHAVLLDALALVRDLPWTAVCAGPVPDPAHLAELRRRSATAGLADRVSWPGPLSGADLDRLWDGTDLLVHPSRSETYGLVVAEAHARGIPTVVGRGTGAEETLSGPAIPAVLPAVSPDMDAETPEASRSAYPSAELPGDAVATDRPEVLAETLRGWLTDPALRRRWRDTALARRGGLPGWDRTADTVQQALARLASPARA